LAGLLAGTLDAAAASLLYFISTGNNPTRVFQYIASAVFGKNAFSGGLQMAAWGLLLHYFIAFTFAALFFLAYPFLLRFVKSSVVMGILLGLIVWLIMNLVIVPLTKAPQLPLKINQAILNIVILMLFVGLPIAVIVRRYYSSKSPTQNIT
jgi:hypothetical protein